MEALERGAKLKHEADNLLVDLRVWEILAEYGETTPTGSYFLDTMGFPDIDLYITQVSLPQMFEIGGRLAAHELVDRVVFEKSPLEALPGGLFECTHRRRAIRTGRNKLDI